MKKCQDEGRKECMGREERGGKAGEIDQECNLTERAQLGGDISQTFHLNPTQPWDLP